MSGYSKAGEKLTMEEAQRRALIFMAGHGPRSTLSPSFIGMHIWPKNKMRSQGLGGAASRILAVMSKAGLVHWVCTNDFWGYCLTAKGREASSKAKEAK